MMDHLGASQDLDSIMFPSKVSVFVGQWPVDVDIDLLELHGVLDLRLILNLQLDSLQKDVSRKLGGRLQLYLDDEEELTGHVVSLRVNGALKHLELTLATQVDPMARCVGAVLEVGRNIAHVKEVGDVSILNVVLVVLQFVPMAFKPRIDIWRYI